MKNLLFFLLSCLCFQGGFAAEKTICLNMIVKDESAVIERGLNTVKDLIDYWVIVDTGSTDGTQEIIRKTLKDIPGELHESPWVNFAHNRNEALDLAKAKADYIFWMDADEVLVFDPAFKLPDLYKDFYYMTVRQLNSVDIMRNALIKASLNWKWEGVLHEVLVCPEVKTYGTLEGVINICNLEGEASGRSQDPEKYLNDAKVLEKGLEDEPENARYAYFLAQSYLAAGKKVLAENAYQRRAAMKGDVHELYLTLYTLGRIQEEGRPELALVNYEKALQVRPQRAEPIHRMAVIYRKLGKPFIGYLLAKEALRVPYPKDELCVEYMAYDHQILIEFANCALLTNRFAEALPVCEKLLKNPHLPEEYRGMVQSNLRMARKNIQGYDPDEVLEIVAQFIPKNPVILEAGAHYGEDTVRFASIWKKAVIHAFEPNPYAFTRLEKISESFPNVYCYPYALNEREGISTFFINKRGGNDGASSLLEASDWMKHYYIEDEVEVACTTLDAWQTAQKISCVDFIWFDLEGIELQVLKHGKNLLSDCKALFVETNHLAFRKGMADYSELKAFLELEGFEEHTYWPTPGIEQGNALFVRSSALAPGKKTKHK